MTSPAVADTSTSLETVNVTTHTVDLSTLTATTGNLLIVAFAHDDDGAGTWTWPGVAEVDYTEIFDVSANGVGLQVRYREIDGTEGTSFDVTSSASEQSAHAVYEVSGAADVSVQAPEASTGANGTDTAPNPDSITPTGGSKDYLVIAVTANNGGDTTVSVYPYADSQLTAESGGANGCSIGMCSDQLTNSTFDPGTFTIDDTLGWVAVTVVVHPPASSIPIMRRRREGASDH